MSEHLSKEQLNKYLDGGLSQEEAAQARAHLAGCDACRREMVRLEAFLEKVKSVRREVAPKVDLWPSIRDERGAQRRRRFTGRRWLWAAAAVLLVAATSTVTWRLSGPSSEVAKGGTSAVMEKLRMLEEDYALAASEVQAAADQTAARLDPETQRLVNETSRRLTGRSKKSDPHFAVIRDDTS